MTPKEFYLFAEAYQKRELDFYDHIYKCAQIANGYIKRIKSLKREELRKVAPEETISMLSELFRSIK